MGKYKFIEERVETMSSSELKIFLNILKSRSKELMSTLESVRGIKDLEAVCKSTQKLNNRVSEFDGGSFLILVVGPVKSGKSTLVNLIAHHWRSGLEKDPAVEQFTVIYQISDMPVLFGEQEIAANAFSVDSTFFKIFPYIISLKSYELYSCESSAASSIVSI